MENLAVLKGLVHGARRILAVTGAGISADSGLPTYRGFGGLYEAGPTEEGLPIEEVLSGSCLTLRPELTWKYLAVIEASCRGKEPNAAHWALAKAQEWAEVLVLTQNIDGLHQRAGSKEVIEIHGNLYRLLCLGCGRRQQVPDYGTLALPPHCPCGALLRPEVVLFGELLPPPKVRSLRAALREDWDLVLSIGTTSLFPYIAAVVIEANRRGIPVVEINPGETQVSHLADHPIRLGAAKALSVLLD
ncbi:MAG: Sir2 family NAD-dependent protein deacetylase [bacterium]|nr:Sir2 family NAD-dependent protein deacetylase [bacterium]